MPLFEIEYNKCNFSLFFRVTNKDNIFKSAFCSSQSARFLFMMSECPLGIHQTIAGVMLRRRSCPGRGGWRVSGTFKRSPAS